MKNILLPNCNRDFLSKIIFDNLRIDGRKKNEFRKISIGYGLNYGCCIVSLGYTKVLASVSCEITEPSINKAYEGLIKIYLDLSPMASPLHEQGKITDECIEVQRLLERTVRESKCVDLESLCLIAGEKVWEIKIDLIVLNLDGNLAECSSVALTAALAHFKRPDVSVVNDKLIIHSFEEKHPISLNLLYYPFCTKFSFFEENIIICDPNELEELNFNGYLIIGTNNFKEVTAIHITGKSQIIKNMILKCCNLACERTNFLTNLIKETLQKDKDSRDRNDEIGFVSLLKSQDNVLFSHKREKKYLVLEEEDVKEIKIEMEFNDSSKTKMYRFSNKTNIISEDDDPEKSWNLPSNTLEFVDLQETKNESKDFVSNKEIEIESDEEISILETSEFAKN